MFHRDGHEAVTRASAGLPPLCVECGDPGEITGVHQVYEITRLGLVSAVILVPLGWLGLLSVLFTKSYSVNFWRCRRHGWARYFRMAIPVAFMAMGAMMCGRGIAVMRWNRTEIHDWMQWGGLAVFVGAMFVGSAVGAQLKVRVRSGRVYVQDLPEEILAKLPPWVECDDQSASGE